ncbi:MAG TPA: response regulator, partial [Pirellulales bacterium]
TRVAREVGTEGKLGGQADVKGVAGTWKDLTDNVNFMAGNLTGQVRNIADVTKAVAAGDLSRKITVDVKGEILELKDTINTMVDQLNSFASEVTRVAREVGTEGKLGGQADVKGVGGTWKDLTDNVNFMAGNLTAQVRNIAIVVTAVANGDLTRKLAVNAQGEIAALADTINGMIDTLATFADQVTSVAREVGVEGKLGGQASVPGAAGTWKDLTDNVNRLAANLTTQVRAIAEVATAVTKGDLTRSITVEAFGEVAELKNNINEMIVNLKDTTLKNSEQDWLKTNMAKFSRMLQGQKDLLAVGRLILSELAPVVSAQQGAFYTMDTTGLEPMLKLLASYAHKERKNVNNTFKLGEGLVGQCAWEREKILLTNVPADYIRITSGLGEAAPLNIIVMPIIFEGQVKAVMELASFDRFSTTHQRFLDQLTESIGIVLNTIEANTRTEDLLKQSQSLAAELQTQQQELQLTNQQLGEKAQLLAQQNVEVERKNQEVEQARRALEEKATQLALTSKYKSEFLANMSHELRTPLNSLLILSDQLARNSEGNLSPRQIEFSQTIHASGNDLLSLINDILDLSKIESGTVALDVGEITFRDLHDCVDRSFRHVAESKRLGFSLSFTHDLPYALQTDVKRLQQVIKNLLSNAFKFTERGVVSFHVSTAPADFATENDALRRAPCVLAISVSDTGIGIAAEKQQLIFEAFQQADGSTSRKYGGTGLGLAISREIANLLGGEIRLQSELGKGSTFTLYLPQVYMPAKAARRDLAPVIHTAKASPQLIEAEAALAADVCAGPPASIEIMDDRDHLQPDDKVMLIVENDLVFSRQVMEMAHDSGFKAVIAPRGAEALILVHKLSVYAVTLDINLPDIDGWRVLARLKEDLRTRHIPVYVVTTEEDRGRAMKLGATGSLAKPLQRRDELSPVFDRLRANAAPDAKTLLVIGADDRRRGELVEMVSGDDVQTIAINMGDAALSALAENKPSCVVLLASPEPAAAFAFLEEMRRRPELEWLPILVYLDGELPPDEEDRLKRFAQNLLIKEVRSRVRLVDEAALFLHRRIDQLPTPRRQMLERIHEPEAVLTGKKVLLVDDDIRNIFAMTGVLERHAMRVFSAETGRAALERLAELPDVDVILMDIMMPHMDGYDTMRAIRSMDEFRSLPIIALTAKAMKGDREKCLEAGASDYIAKPVDVEHLLAMLRVWLYR